MAHPSREIPDNKFQISSDGGKTFRQLLTGVAVLAEPVSISSTVMEGSTISFSCKSDDKHKDYIISKIEVLSANKVIRVTFESSSTGWIRAEEPVEIKSVCSNDDEFSLRKGVLVCVAKYLYGDTFCSDKMEYIADMLDWYKVHNKKVTRAIKVYGKSLKEAELAKEKEAKDKIEKQSIIERRRAKKAKKRADGKVADIITIDEIHAPSQIQTTKEI